MRQLALFLFMILLFAITALSAEKLYTQVLYTQVRVQVGGAGGSGTVIYSEKKGNFFSTYVITCHHVIDKAVKLEEKWNPLLQKERKVELRQPVLVELFNYNVPHGHSPLTSGLTAELVTWDDQHDMAILHMDLAERPAVAKLLPPQKIEAVNIGAPVTIAGCALLHDPVLTQGIITHLGDIIEGKRYWMSNSAIIYGNSGGAVFLQNADNFYFIGIPSRIDVIQGYNQAVPHLGYFSPITRVYEFIESELLHFLVPGSEKSEAQCLAERAEKREAAEKQND